MLPIFNDDQARRVAHDFNNILMAISPFAELIRRTSGDDRITAYAKQISAAVRRGEDVTRELVSRPAFCDVSLDVQSALERITSEPRSHTQFHLRACHASLAAAIHEDAFDRVTRDILSFFCDDEKAGHLFVSAETCTSLRFPSAQGENSHAIQRLVHVKFRSLRSGESQAPVSPPKIEAAREIAGINGIQILVEETEGGTVIHLLLPGSDSVPSHLPEHTAAAADTRIERAVVVEDDELVAAGLVGMLATARVTAEVAATPPDAIAAIERLRPDVLILDVHLGEHDGIQLYREIEARFPSLPVVFSTGHAAPADFEWLAGKPHVRLLQKPYTIELLFETLSAAVAAVEKEAR